MLLAHVQGVYVFFLFIFFISVAQGAMSAACKGSMVDFYFSGTHYLLLCIIICYAGGDECCLPTSKGSMVFYFFIYLFIPVAQGAMSVACPRPRGLLSGAWPSGGRESWCMYWVCLYVGAWERLSRLLQYNAPLVSAILLRGGRVG